MREKGLGGEEKCVVVFSPNNNNNNNIGNDNNNVVQSLQCHLEYFFVTAKSATLLNYCRPTVTAYKRINISFLKNFVKID